MGQIKMDYRFLSNEDMLLSGVYLNSLLDEMEQLAQQLKQVVDVELQYAKGKIVEKSLSEVEERTVVQIYMSNLQKYNVVNATRQYNEIYNDIAVQPITITYKIKEPVKTSMVFGI